VGIGDIGPRYLGFALPYDLTWRQGARDKSPGRGVCWECGKHREKVYARGDGTLICLYCIHYALARPVLIDQSPSPVVPVETIWDKVYAAGGRDLFDTIFWNKALA
jgi:hypothetical protein